MNILLFFENNVGADWIRVYSGPRGSSLLRLHGQAGAAWAEWWPNSPGASKDNLFPSAAGNQPGELDLARKIFLSTASD